MKPQFVKLAALSTAAAFVVTACSVPNLSMSRDVDKTTGKASVVASRTAPVAKAAAVKVVPHTHTPTRPRPAGELDSGTVTHTVQVGPYRAVIIYYTSDNAKLYRNSSTKTIHVAVHMAGADGRQTILVNNFYATFDDGTTRAQIKHDPLHFSVTPPQSYNSIVTMPATADHARSVKLIVELDFSIQTTPTSTLYASQTALDSITLPLLTGSQT